MKGLVKLTGKIVERQVFDRTTRAFEQRTFFQLQELNHQYDEECTLRRYEEWLHVQCPFGAMEDGSMEDAPRWNVCLEFYGGKSEPRESCEEVKPSEHGFRVSTRPNASWFKDMMSTVVISVGILGAESVATEVHVKYSSLDVS